jgi:hypothetical protein
MRTRLVVLAGFLASTITFPTIRAVAAPAPRPDEKGIRLIGCLVKGDDGYLLTNLPSASSTGSPAAASSILGAVGTAGAYSTVVYWLDGNDDLKHHIGHRVEVVGNIKGDPKNAKIRLQRYLTWTEMEVKAGGHTLKALVPTVVPASYVGIDSRVSAVVRKVDVDHVFMLSVGCQ